MEWYEAPERFLALSVVGVTAGLLYIALNLTNETRLAFPFLTLTLCLPMIMFSLYMWISGNGRGAILGMDWTGYTEEEIRETTSYTGLWHMIPMILIIYGMAIIFVKFFIGAALVFIGIAILLSKIMRPTFGVKVKALPDMNAGFAAFLAIVILLISVVPTTLLLTAGMQNLENGTSSLSMNSSDMELPTFKGPYCEIEEDEPEADLYDVMHIDSIIDAIQIWSFCGQSGTVFYTNP